MGHSLPKRNRIWTIMVTLSCLGGAIYSARLLYDDIMHVDEGGSGEPIAKIEKFEDKVRRKPASRYSWNNVGENQKLYWKDSIQTGPASSASIRLSDGSLVELGEASLVVMDQTDQLSLNFLRGSVIVRSATGQDTQLTVTKDGKKKVETLPARLLLPSHLSEFYSINKETIELQFKWKAAPTKTVNPGESTEPKLFRLQVSDQRNFPVEKTKELQIAPATEMSSIVSLQPGTYFWRVLSPDQTPTEIRQIMVSEAHALDPTWPPQEHAKKTYDPSTAISFRWAPPETVHSGIRHRLEVSQDADFKTVLKSQPISASTGTYQISDLPLGKYFWRLSSLYGEHSLTSSIRSFSIVKAETFDITLLYPAANSSFELLPKVRFTWSSDAPGGEYIWEIKNRAGKTIQESKTTANSQEWKEIAAGSYEWRVRLQIGTQVVGTSEWRTLSFFKGQPIALVSPQDGSEFYSWDQPKPFELKWKADSIVEDSRKSKEHNDVLFYRVEVADDPQFKTILASKQTQQNSLSRNDFGKDFPHQNFYWRVKIVNANQQTIKTSSYARVLHGPYPTLPAPTDLKPGIGSVYNLSVSDREPDLEWHPVREATRYEITVTAVGRSPAETKERPPQISVDPRTSLRGLPEGRYAWSVRAIDRLNRRGEPTPPRAFTITLGETLPPPKPKSEEVQ